MHAIYFVICALLTTCFSAGQSSAGMIECPANDETCEKDKFGFEAINQLHLQVDDDRNGNLDREESDELSYYYSWINMSDAWSSTSRFGLSFLKDWTVVSITATYSEYMREELKYEDGFDRQANFHGTDDLISVEDLWISWVQSEVHNWTVDDVIEWLEAEVDLPQYGQNFRINDVDGRVLPRIATNTQYLSSILGIKSAVHKQKLALKATDLVLFGTKKAHSYIKDFALVASVVIAVGGCWLAYVQHRYSQSHLLKVMKDLEQLQKAEDALRQLQNKFETAQLEHKSISDEKQYLEEKLKGEMNSAKSEAENLRCQRETTEEEISRLKLAEDELVQVRRALRRAEMELEERQHAPLAELQQWLQLTYEIEQKNYETKRESTEKQLYQAKEMCEKIRRKRGAFLGSFRIAHTTSIDDTDHSIMRARVALEEVQRDLQEKTNRWSQIEKICGFNILDNPGTPFLEALLTRGASQSFSQANSRGRGVIGPPLTVDEADEDAPPGSLTSAAAFYSQPLLMKPKEATDDERHSYSMPALDGARHAHLITALQPVIPSDGRRPTLTSAFVSTNSIQSIGSTTSLPQGSKSRISGRDHSPDDATEDRNSIGSPSSMNGGVKFDLGNGMESSVSTPDQDEMRERTHSCGSDGTEEVKGREDSSHSLGKSVSLDATSSGLARPRTVPSSLSESAIVVGSKTHIPIPLRRLASPKSMSNMSGLTENDKSSHESLEGLSVEEKKEKKKKKSFLTKLLKTTPDKNKTS